MNAFLAGRGGGDVIAATVTGMAFGPLLEGAPGIQGLPPHAEWTAAPATGATISVRITSLDVETRRMTFVAA